MFSPSSAALRPSSNAAATVIALPGPMPLIRQSLEIGIVPSLQSLSSEALSSSRDSSITFLPFFPVRRSIAISSVLLNASAPFAIIFSRGSSSLQSSFSFMPQNYAMSGYINVWRCPVLSDFSVFACFFRNYTLYACLWSG